MSIDTDRVCQSRCDYMNNPQGKSLQNHTTTQAPEISPPLLRSDKLILWVASGVVYLYTVVLYFILGS